MNQGIGQKFIELSGSDYTEESEQERGLPQPPLELPYTGDRPLIDLPRGATLDLGNQALRQVIDQRRSLRRYALEPLSLDELSFLLWSTQGVREVTRRPATLRTVPSAGARHTFETYLLVNHVSGLQPGLYRYLAVENQLAEVELSTEINHQVTDACSQQQQIQTSAVTFIWDAVVARMRWRYGERGYRYLFLDAGHICQNLYLAAEAIDCGVCAIGAFDDHKLNQLLGLDGKEQFVVYLGSVGKKR